MKISINREAIIDFFDEAPQRSGKHATSIVAIAGEELGVGLLKHLLETDGCSVSILDQTPTQGTQSGVRLDRWLFVKEGSHDVLYQVEIKNWSSHSIGGRRVSDFQTIELHRTDRWNHYWKALHNKTDQALRKVLVPMKRPTAYAAIVDVRPLVCVWDALHPNGSNEALFDVEVADAAFSRVWFFSMSNYLRSLDESEVEIEMPAAFARVEWLRRLFPSL